MPVSAFFGESLISIANLICTLAIAPLTKEEKDIIRAGSLINYNRMLKK